MRLRYPDFLALVWWLILPATLLGQLNTTSPYSGFGIGDLLQPALSRNFGMGGTGIAGADPFAINPHNPAAAASLLSMSFDFSGFAQQSQLHTANQETFNLSTAGLYGLAMVLKKDAPIAFSAGILPYSAIGYKLIERGTLDDRDTTEFISIRAGEGGINEFYAGGAFKIWKDKLAFGLNIRYLFGNVNTQWVSQLPATLPKIYDRKERITGVSFQVGVQFTDSLNIGSDNAFWRIGLLVEAGPDLNANRNTSLNLPRSNIANISEDVQLPLGETEMVLQEVLDSDSSVAVSLPTRYGIGLAIDRPLKYFVGLDFSYQDWTDFVLSPDETGTDLRLKVGGEWIPDFNAPKNILLRSAYRLGGRYNQTYIQINDQPIEAWHLAMGMGIPFSRRNPTRLNLGLDIGWQGSTEQNLILENTYRVVIGVSFNEFWLSKRKYK